VCQIHAEPSSHTTYAVGTLKIARMWAVSGQINSVQGTLNSSNEDRFGTSPQLGSDEIPIREKRI
jgi:hypothetical protein